MPTTNFSGLELFSGVSSVVKSDVAILRSSCVFKTKGAFRETAKELVAISERLKINTAKNFIDGIYLKTGLERVPFYDLFVFLPFGDELVKGFFFFLYAHNFVEFVGFVAVVVFF